MKKAGTEAAAPASPVITENVKKAEEKKKKLDDLDALLWDNALGEAEKMDSDSSADQ